MNGCFYGLLEWYMDYGWAKMGITQEGLFSLTVCVATLAAWLLAFRKNLQVSVM